MTEGTSHDATQGTQAATFLYVSVVEQEDENADLAAALAQWVAGRMPGSVQASASYLRGGHTPSGVLRDQGGKGLEDWLRSGFRGVLLVPWCRQDATEPLLRAVSAALEAHTRAAVRYASLPMPTVHVDGISARTPLGGLASARAQLGPLIRQLPGWHDEYSCFAAGGARVVLPRTYQGAQEWRENAVARDQSQALLLHGLQGGSPFQNASRWQHRIGAGALGAPSERDASIYVAYLANLLFGLSRAAFPGEG